jgi:hypothetical protein
VFRKYNMKTFRQVLPGHALLLMMLLSSSPAWAALTVTTGAALPSGVVGKAYATALTAMGGTAPYIWTVAAGFLPPGLSLASSGVISGMPATAGTFQIIASVTDSASPTPASTLAPLSITIAPASVALSITTVATLPDATIGAAYSQALAATGGTPPYTWSIPSGNASLPPGLGFSSSGVLSGTPTTEGDFSFTILVTDGISAAVQQTFSITVSAPGPTRTGVLSQVASGGGWKTSLYLVNTSTAAVPVTVKFWSNTGTALSLPLAVTQAGATHVSTTSNVSTTVARNATLLIESDSGASVGTVGWAEVISTGPITGYGVFHFTSSGGIESEGTVPMEASFAPSFILPYDGTDGFVTGVALTNLMAAQTTSVSTTVWDMDGKQLATKTLSLPKGGHSSFMLADTFPSTVGKRGIIEFRTSSTTSNISGLGLRVSPVGGFTSVPNLHRP